MQFKKLIIIATSYFFLLLNFSNADTVKNIIINGNERISDETILVFSSIKIGDEVNNKKLNEIVNNLYDTNFFDNVSTIFENQILQIQILESPIIDNVIFKGIKSKTLKSTITKNILLKKRSSFNKYQAEKDKLEILKSLKNLGYYNSTIEILAETKDNNTLDLVYEINIGEKAKIEKITFTGNKVYKDSKLKSVIISEEYKFWKFISGKKYLNENVTSLDSRLLKNFNLNKGYLNVKINSSFAKAIDKK